MIQGIRLKDCQFAKNSINQLKMFYPMTTTMRQDLDACVFYVFSSQLASILLNSTLFSIGQRLSESN